MPHAITEVKGEDVLKVIYTLTVLAFMIERALAIFFEWKHWIQVEEALHRWFGLKGLKEAVAVAVAWAVIVHIKLDALAELFAAESNGWTRLLTALIVAGGSKGAVRLMQEYFDIRKPELRTPKRK